MSDRYHSLTVILAEDVKDEDGQHLIDAIGMMRGVLKVEPNVTDHVARTAIIRARNELGQKLFKVIHKNE